MFIQEIHNFIQKSNMELNEKNKPENQYRTENYDAASVRIHIKILD